jgi:hypothetical protein
MWMAVSMVRKSYREKVQPTSHCARVPVMLAHLFGMFAFIGHRQCAVHFSGQSPVSESIFSHAMRKIGSKRIWSGALSTILLTNSIQVGLHAQQPAKLSPKVIAVVNAPPVELKDDDAPLLRLKKERFNAALNEAKARFDLYSRGLTRIPELIEMGERLFSAEVDLYDNPEEKTKILQRQLDVYNEAEANLAKQVKAGLATPADLERLRYNRISVEIDLLNIKNMPDKHESQSNPRQDKLFSAAFSISVPTDAHLQLHPGFPVPR